MKDKTVWTQIILINLEFHFIFKKLLFKSQLILTITNEIGSHRQLCHPMFVF
uniref:Uncharacterized protein n=1 Tax=Nelumbo nucifera TaxID=4432 RepID=A0A822YGJ8_NELNU|nr:TPA_asm: hypothetical protein HUJ06_010468 [Nelumbo nucifera]